MVCSEKQMLTLRLANLVCRLFLERRSFTRKFEFWPGGVVLNVVLQVITAGQSLAGDVHLASSGGQRCKHQQTTSRV